MRSVTYSMGVSLDGYIVGPDGDFDRLSVADGVDGLVEAMIQLGNYRTAATLYEGGEGLREKRRLPRKDGRRDVLYMAVHRAEAVLGSTARGAGRRHTGGAPEMTGLAVTWTFARQGSTSIVATMPCSQWPGMWQPMSRSVSLSKT